MLGLHSEYTIPAPPERRHIKLGLVFFGGFVGLVLIIAACVTYAPVPLRAAQLVYQLNNDITSYKAAGLTELSKSKFSLQIGLGDEIVGAMLSLESDPGYVNIEQVKYSSTYSAKVFSATTPLSLLNEYNETNLDVEQLLYVNFTAAYAAGVNIISTSVPLWKTTLSDLPETQCTSENGVFVNSNNESNSNSDSSYCEKQYILNTVCVKIEMNSATKKWENSGKGCLYPFNEVGEYSQVPNSDLALENHEIVFFVRSADDPYLALGALSKGALAFNNEATPSVVISLSIAGGVLIAVCVFITALLHFQNIDRSSTFNTRPFVFRYLVIFLVSITTAGGVGLVLINHWTSEPYWQWSPFVGVWVLILCCPISVYSIMMFWSNILKTPWKAGLRFGLSIMSSVVILTMCGIGLWLLVNPGNFTIGVFKHQVDLTMMFTGIFFNLVMIPLCLLNISVCLRSIVRLRNGDECKHVLKPKARCTPGRHRWLVIFGIMIVASVFAASIFMPPKYNKPVIPKPVTTIFNNYANYLDIVVFYGYITLVVVTVILASVFKTIYNFLNYWIKLRVWRFSVHTTIGEILVVFVYSLLVAWWIWYWMYLNAPTTVTRTEQIALGFGQLTNLFVASLLFPVTRNSMWVQLVGMPFEHTIKYHKWLGRFTLMAFTAHMVTYWVVWKKAGTLIHNMFSLQNIPNTTFWSVPMMELLWVGAIICMGVLSYSWIRRHKFELFYYAHHFAVIVFVVSMLHASRGWYFFSAGLILWFTDRIVRFWKGTKAFRVLDIKAHEGVTEIQIQQNGFEYQAGQYAFINIPTISALEWHPFSITSSPGEDIISFHIKNMGTSTWTSKLGELSRMISVDEGELKKGVDMPIVNIDGPYGAPSKFDTSSVLFIAGGIGITPIISILKDLWNNKAHKSVSTVNLIWIVKESSMLHMFQNTLITFLASTTSIVKITSTVYVTQNNKEKTLSKIMIKNGRPNLYESIGSISVQSGTDLSVVVCGPKSLVNQVQEICHTFSIQHYFAKTFIL